MTWCNNVDSVRLVCLNVDIMLIFVRLCVYISIIPDVGTYCLQTSCNYMRSIYFFILDSGGLVCWWCMSQITPRGTVPVNGRTRTDTGLKCSPRWELLIFFFFLFPSNSHNHLDYGTTRGNFQQSSQQRVLCDYPSGVNVRETSSWAVISLCLALLISHVHINRWKPAVCVCVWWELARPPPHSRVTVKCSGERLSGKSIHQGECDGDKWRGSRARMSGLYELEGISCWWWEHW